MIREALEFLFSEAREERFKRVLQEKENDTYLDVKSGSVIKVPKRAPSIGAKILDLDSLRQFIATQIGDESLSDPACIFVNDDSIVTVIDYSEYADERVTTPLNVSSIWMFLSNSSISGDPKTVIKKLKHNVCSIADDVYPFDITEKLGVLKFERSSEESHAVRPRDEAVSRSLKASVSNPEKVEIPSFMTVEFAVYPEIEDQLDGNDYTTVASVKLDIDIDPTEGTIRITPFPGSLKSARLAALSNIAGFLKSTVTQVSSCVFLGSP